MILNNYCERGRLQRQDREDESDGVQNMYSVFATTELKGLRCRKLFSSSIDALPAISGSVRPCFYINNCLRKFTNDVCQKILVPPTLKNNREPWLTPLILLKLHST